MASVPPLVPGSVQATGCQRNSHSPTPPSAPREQCKPQEPLHPSTSRPFIPARRPGPTVQPVSIRRSIPEPKAQEDQNTRTSLPWSTATLSSQSPHIQQGSSFTASTVFLTTRQHCRRHLPSCATSTRPAFPAAPPGRRTTTRSSLPSLRRPILYMAELCLVQNARTLPTRRNSVWKTIGRVTVMNRWSPARSSRCCQTTSNTFIQAMALKDSLKEGHL